MATKKGLGRGIGALLGENNVPAKTTTSEESSNVSRETLLNINLIEPDRNQPRKKFDEDKLTELADSIKLHGIVQPLVVQKSGKTYTIIAGERRWRAARLAGLKEVPVVIKEYSDAERFEIAIIENIQREDLNAIEEALAYKRLATESNYTQDEIAEKVSKSRVAVTNSMRLLNLDERVQQMVVDELISGGHARALLSISDGNLQHETAMKVLDEKLSVRETEKLVKSMSSEKKAKEDKKALPDEAIYRGYENNLRSLVGTKVEIQRKEQNKGKIVIDFYSVEDFEKIYSIIKKGSND